MDDNNGTDKDEVSIEPDAASENLRDPAEQLRRIREKLRACERERQEYLDGWQRAKADLINARKRDAEERGEFLKLANERLIESLLPVLTSFDLAMGNREAWERADKNWRTGVEHIAGQLKKALADEGLQEISPEGESFDHFLHEAAHYEPVPEPEKDQRILSVVQKGYTLNGKLLKPAKVVVGEFAKGSPHEAR